MYAPERDDRFCPWEPDHWFAVAVVALYDEAIVEAAPASTELELLRP